MVAAHLYVVRSTPASSQSKSPKVERRGLLNEDAEQEERQKTGDQGHLQVQKERSKTWWVSQVLCVCVLVWL